MSQVRNLRAMFEQKGDSSPPDRGRSPAVTSSNASSPRPLSKVRTSFVAIEKDGRIGLQRDQSQDSSTSMSASKASIEPEGAASPPAAQTRSSPLADRTKLSDLKDQRVPATPPKRPLQPVTPGQTPNISPAASIKKTPSLSPENSSVKEASPRISPSPLATYQAPASDSSPTRLNGNGKAPSNGTPPANGTPPSIGPEPGKAKALAASKDLSINSAGGPTKAAVKSSPLSATRAAAAAVAAATSTTKPAKSPTKSPAKSPAKSPTKTAPVTKSPTVAKAPTKAPVAKAPAPTKAPTAAPTKAPVAAKAPAKASTAPKARSRSPDKTAPKPTTKTSTTSAQRPRRTSPPAHTGFVKPRVKSPTRPVKLPSSLTTHTAASGSKLNVPPRQSSSRAGARDSSMGRSPSRTSPSHSGSSITTKPPAARGLRRQSSTINRPRPSLGPPPKQPAKDHPPTRREKQVDEGFLARMMRPTQASSSKTIDKTSTTPPRHSASSTTPKKASGRDSKAARRPVARQTAGTPASARATPQPSTRGVTPINPSPPSSNAPIVIGRFAAEPPLTPTTEEVPQTTAPRTPETQTVGAEASPAGAEAESQAEFTAAENVGEDKEFSTLNGGPVEPAEDLSVVEGLSVAEDVPAVAVEAEGDSPAAGAE